MNDVVTGGESLSQAGYYNPLYIWIDWRNRIMTFPIEVYDLWLDSYKWVVRFPSHVYTKAPWSGDVTQCIHAWGQAISQFGLFNVNYVNSENSGDPPTEWDVTAKYSYGRQLGRILDVLAPLVEKNAIALLNADMPDKRLDYQDLNDFRDMVKDVSRIKSRRE